MNHESPTPLRRRFLTFGVAAVLLVAAAGLATPFIIRGIAHFVLADLGFSGAQGGGVSLGPRHLRLSQIAIGRKSTMTVGVTFSPGALIHGRLDTITISETALHGTIGLNGSIVLDGFLPPPAKSGPAAPIRLPARTVLIERVSLEIETPAGPVTVIANGTLTGAEDGLRLTGAVDLTKDEIAVSAPFDFTQSPGGWSLTAAPIRVAFPGKTGAANVADGRMSIGKTGDDAVTGTGQIDGRDLVVATIPIRKLGLNFSIGAQGQSGHLELAPADGSAGIVGDFNNAAGILSADLKARFAEIDAIAKASGAGGVSGPLQAGVTLHADAGSPRLFSVAAAYDGATPAGVIVRAAKIEATGVFDPAANSVTLSSCGGFSADTIAIATVSLSKLSGCVGPMDGPPLFSQDASGKTSLATMISNISATVSSGKESLAETTFKSAAVYAHLADGRATGFDVRIDGGAFAMPSLGAGVKDFVANAKSAVNGSVSGTLSATFAPAGAKGPSLPISGSIGGTLADGIKLALTAGASDHLPIVKAAIGRQGATIDMAATTLGEGGADLIALMPRLATKVSKLSGTMSANAIADWSGSAFGSHGNVVLKDIGATTANFTVEGLEGMLAFNSLAPLTTATEQRLTTKRLLVGIPLTDGDIRFSLSKRILNIAEAQWAVAGGTIGTYDQQLDLYGPDQNLGVVVKGVDVAQLLALVDVNGLSAKGTLDGAIPLRHIDDTILVQHGYVQTRSAGSISYDPADTPAFLQGQPGEGTTILRDALKDFHYQQLGITIDGTLGGEEKIKMNLTGANPKVYGGSAIALNLNLSGALDSIARSSVEAYTHPTETVRRKLQKKPGDKK